MNFKALQQEIEDAANRAMEQSAELREIVGWARMNGFDIDAKLEITVMPAVTVEGLEALFQLKDRRLN